MSLNTNIRETPVNHPSLFSALAPRYQLIEDIVLGMGLVGTVVLVTKPLTVISCLAISAFSLLSILFTRRCQPLRSDMLIQVASRGAIDSVELLLWTGVDINYQDPLGRTALSRARQNGHNEVVQALLRAGAIEQ